VALDLQRMLDKCLRDQWRIDDLDWSVTPRRMDRDTEIAVVQYFTDMSGIELLAAELFLEQRRRSRDPILKHIFSTFVIDEQRHSQVAARLARHYDVHRYRDYRLNEHLVHFRKYFVAAIRQVSAEIANAYITSGEILLDVALLRSLDDFVDDEMSHQAMHLINRDESRHIAVDFHMVEHYVSPEHRREADARPWRGVTVEAKRAYIFSRMVLAAGPFLRDVFFAPMDLTDPSGKRMFEAFKRIQIMGRRPDVASRPFSRFLRTLQVLFNQPVTGRLFGRTLSRIMGVDPRVMVELYDAEEERHGRQIDLQEMANEVLALKYDG
jgi:hypothetical protein